MGLQLHLNFYLKLHIIKIERDKVILKLTQTSLKFLKTSQTPVSNRFIFIPNSSRLGKDRTGTPKKVLIILLNVTWVNARYVI